MSGSSEAALAGARYDVTRYLHIRAATVPALSPEGDTLAFLWDVTGVPQIWTVAVDAQAWPEQSTFFPDRVATVQYGRRQPRLLGATDTGGNERWQLFLLDDRGATLTWLTQEPGVIHVPGDWDPEERQFAYASNRRNEAFFDLYVHRLGEPSGTCLYQHDGTNYVVGWWPLRGRLIFVRQYTPLNHDLFVLALDTQRPELLTPHDGDAVYESVQLSPDGRGLYCVTDQDREFQTLAYMPLDGSGLRQLLVDLPYDVESCALAPTGTRLAYTTNEEGYSYPHLFDTASEESTRLPVPAGVIGSLTWSGDGQRLAFALSTASTNSDIWLFDVATRQLRRVTFSPRAGIPEQEFATPELQRYPSRDGLMIPIFVFRPRQPGRGPAVMWVHGGPESQFRPGFAPILQYLVHRGLTVLAPNVRGSTGYGKRYTHLDDVHKRMDSVRDLADLVAWAREQPDIDVDRLGLWGGSYGGFMVLAALTTYPELWAAGVDIVGIANFITFLQRTGPWRRKLREAEYGSLATDADFLRSISPIHRVDRIRAPLFVIHGANDPRVPIYEAEQIVDALRQRNQAVEYLRFEDEGHGLVKLQNKIVGYAAGAEFLVRHLLATYARTVAANG